MWIAVTIGKVNDNLALIELDHACVPGWNTSRSKQGLLKMDVATTQPTYQLQVVSYMMVKFSTLLWFQIKRHSYLIDGAHYTLMRLQIVKTLV